MCARVDPVERAKWLQLQPKTPRRNRIREGVGGTARSDAAAARCETRGAYLLGGDNAVDDTKESKGGMTNTGRERKGYVYQTKWTTTSNKKKQRARRFAAHTAIHYPSPKQNAQDEETLLTLDIYSGSRQQRRSISGISSKWVFFPHAKQSEMKTHFVVEEPREGQHELRIAHPLWRHGEELQWRLPPPAESADLVDLVNGDRRRGACHVGGRTPTRGAFTLENKQ